MCIRDRTITEFLYDLVSLYGEKKWGVSIDVYKRQLLNNVRHHIQNAFGNDISSDEFISPDGDSVTIVSCKNGMQPVSYTHLDVYKRQFLHSVSSQGQGSGVTGAKTSIDQK